MEIYDLIEGDVLITFSPDGNSIPELIPPLVANWIWIKKIPILQKNTFLRQYV